MTLCSEIKLEQADLSVQLVEKDHSLAALNR